MIPYNQYDFSGKWRFKDNPDESLVILDEGNGKFKFIVNQEAKECEIWFERPNSSYGLMSPAAILDRPHATIFLEENEIQLVSHSPTMRKLIRD